MDETKRGAAEEAVQPSDRVETLPEVKPRRGSDSGDDLGGEKEQIHEWQGPADKVPLTSGREERNIPRR